MIILIKDKNIIIHIKQEQNLFVFNLIILVKAMVIMTLKAIAIISHG